MGPIPGIGFIQVAARAPQAASALVALDTVTVQAVPSFLPVLTEGGNIFGSTFVANPDGSFSCLESLFGVAIGITLVCSFASNRTVVIGVGLGSTESVPAQPGQYLNDTYLSRFVCARRGEGAGRTTTFDLYVAPVGKSTTDAKEVGIELGDTIFLCAWSEDGDTVPVEVKELIITLEAIV